jgi:hypothetical protein
MCITTGASLQQWTSPSWSWIGRQKWRRWGRWWDACQWRWQPSRRSITSILSESIVGLRQGGSRTISLAVGSHSLHLQKRLKVPLPGMPMSLGLDMGTPGDALLEIQSGDYGLVEDRTE